MESAKALTLVTDIIVGHPGRVTDYLEDAIWTGFTNKRLSVVTCLAFPIPTWVILNNP